MVLGVVRGGVGRGVGLGVGRGVWRWVGRGVWRCVGLGVWRWVGRGVWRCVGRGVCRWVGRGVWRCWFRLACWLRLGWLRLGWLRLGWLRFGWLRLGWLRLGWLRLGWFRLPDWRLNRICGFRTETSACLGPSTIQSARAIVTAKQGKVNGEIEIDHAHNKAVALLTISLWTGFLLMRNVSPLRSPSWIACRSRSLRKLTPKPYWENRLNRFFWILLLPGPVVRLATAKKSNCACLNTTGRTWFLKNVLTDL